jgi:hypothetical protein
MGLLELLLWLFLGVPQTGADDPAGAAPSSTSTVSMTMDGQEPPPPPKP